MNKATSSHQRKVKAALDAIETVFADTSISQLATISSLREIRDDVEMKIEAIEADIKRGQK